MLQQSTIPSASRLPSPPGLRVAFIQAGWHSDIVDQCRLGFIAEMASLGHAASDIDVYEVAGAFEIPLQAKLLAAAGTYSAIVAAGLVVDGGIYRHEFVAQAVISGLMEVQLATSVPVISAVLTPHHFHAGDEHREFFTRHFLVKGAEAARACAATMRAVAEIVGKSGKETRNEAATAELA
jgi:6,7-dimethyl-8-ribityllumazine synthase